MIAHPAQHGLRRNADVLGDRVHRKAKTVKLDRMPLQRRRLAARFRAGELSTAAFALPALPATGMARLDHRAAVASWAGMGALVHRIAITCSSTMPFR
jgi:hypothetical protein